MLSDDYQGVDLTIRPGPDESCKSQREQMTNVPGVSFVGDGMVMLSKTRRRGLITTRHPDTTMSNGPEDKMRTIAARMPLLQSAWLW